MEDNNWQFKLLEELRLDLKEVQRQTYEAINAYQKELNDSFMEVNRRINEMQLKQEASEAKLKIYVFLTNAVLSGAISALVALLILHYETK